MTEIFNGESNDTTEIDSNSFTVISYVNSLTFILTVIFIAGMILNTISIAAIFKSKKFEPINILILNLAFADLIYTLGIPLFTAHIFSMNWSFGLIGCRFFFLTDFIGMIVGTYTVAALSVERYLEVADESKILEKYSAKFKQLIMCAYVLSIWLLGTLCSLPIVFSITLDFFELDSTYSCGSTWTDNQMTNLFIIKFVFIIVIPFTVILLSSTKLLIFLKKWKKESLQSQNLSLRYECKIGEESRLVEKKLSITKCIIKKNTIRQKAIKIVLSIVICFIGQWTPLWVGEIYKVTTTSTYEYIQLINIMTTLLSYSNSISNPLLYIFLTHKFQMIQNLREYIMRLYRRYIKADE